VLRSRGYHHVLAGKAFVSGITTGQLDKGREVDGLCATVIGRGVSLRMVVARCGCLQYDESFL
jgi:hypothetical protein